MRQAFVRHQQMVVLLVIQQRCLPRLCATRCRIELSFVLFIVRSAKDTRDAIGYICAADSGIFYDRRTHSRVAPYLYNVFPASLLARCESVDYSKENELILTPKLSENHQLRSSSCLRRLTKPTRTPRSRVTPTRKRIQQLYLLLPIWIPYPRVIEGFCSRIFRIWIKVTYTPCMRFCAVAVVP